MEKSWEELREMISDALDQQGCEIVNMHRSGTSYSPDANVLVLRTKDEHDTLIYRSFASGIGVDWKKSKEAIASFYTEILAKGVQAFKKDREPIEESWKGRCEHLEDQLKGFQDYISRLEGIVTGYMAGTSFEVPVECVNQLILEENQDLKAELEKYHLFTESTAANLKQLENATNK